MSEVIDTFVAPVCNDDIEILFQDESILLINKPSGLLSLSGKNPLNKDSVHFRLVQLFSTATMIHRLDFGTSGLMVLALNKAVNGNLTRQFQNRTVDKTYTAILDGHVSDDIRLIDLPIAKDPANFPLMKICQEEGKPAISRLKVLERLDEPFARGVSRVRFTPQTGRTHQLRIHSREIGHSILGDDLYGLSDASDISAERLMLHATSLAFDHPVTAERLEWECPCLF